MSDEKKKDQLSLNLDSKADEKPDEAIVVPADEGDILEWVCHPAKRNMKVTVMVTAFLLVLLVLVYWWTLSVWFVVLGALILFGSLSAFYFPTKYKLSSEKIVVKTVSQTLEKDWKQYRTFYPDKHGVLLSPFTRSTRLENFRGIYIKFWYNKEEVIAFVEQQIKAHHIHDDED